MKTIFLLAVACTVALLGHYYASAFVAAKHAKRLLLNTASDAEVMRLSSFATEATQFAAANNYNTNFCFLLDMGLPSGQNRFFVYNLAHDSIEMAGLVAHGSCNSQFLEKAKFSNQPGCGCSAKGKYRVGYKYDGRFGIAYKLYGLESTNSNAYDRFIVLHSYNGVPEYETKPYPICNSLGCAMVSDGFIKRLAIKIDASQKPLLLWMFD